MTSALFVVAVVGAVVLARRPRSARGDGEPAPTGEGVVRRAKGAEPGPTTTSRQRRAEAVGAGGDPGRRRARRHGGHGAMSVAASWYLTLAAVLFTIGAIGLLIRRNVLVMFMCVELMLNAVEPHVRDLRPAAQRHRRPDRRVLRAGGRGRRGGRRPRDHRRRSTGAGRGNSRRRPRNEGRSHSAPLVYLIPLLPLAGFVILLLAGRKLGNPRPGWLATSWWRLPSSSPRRVHRPVPAAVGARSYTQTWFTWINAGHLHVTCGLLVDPLSITMAAVRDRRERPHPPLLDRLHGARRDFPKFFVVPEPVRRRRCCMLVLARQLPPVVPRLGGRGRLLVLPHRVLVRARHRIERRQEGDRSSTASGTRRSSSALFLIYERTGSLDYHTVFADLAGVGEPSLVGHLAAAVARRRRQVGPDPALSLAGRRHGGPDTGLGPHPRRDDGDSRRLSHVPGSTRSWYRAPERREVVAIVGAATALLGATIACAQNDIKKILAYSTISQLGYMFLAAGIGAYDAAISLMLTHAFYKALLFLGAGSVIHAMNDDQDVKTMGALARRMPITAVTFFIGWLSIGGVPVFSGFWSKGDVLLNSFGFSPALWAIGALDGRC